MGTKRCWQINVVHGFRQRKTRTTVAERKKVRRIAVRKIVAELKAAGKKVDLQAINQDVVNIYRRRKHVNKKK